MADAKQDLDRSTQNFLVDDASAGERLDIVVARHLTQLSRSKIQRLIADGAVLINNTTAASAKVPVKTGDQISVQVPAAIAQQSSQAAIRTPATAPASFQLDVLYEDQYLLVINKPAGLSVHAADGQRSRFTLVDALLARSKQWSRMQTDADGAGGKFRPGIVHRLDRDTSGVMVCCKDDATHEHLAKQFREKSNLREYMAILDGYMGTGHIVCESYLHRHPRVRNRFAAIDVATYEELKREGADLTGYRHAKTEFWCRATFGQRLTLATARLHTGRTHQIRVHAADIKLPVLGDQLYHRRRELPAVFAAATRMRLEELQRQMLHARILGFVHPQSGEHLAFEAPPPTDFMDVIQLLAAYDDKQPKTKS